MHYIFRLIETRVCHSQHRKLEGVVLLIMKTIVDQRKKQEIMGGLGLWLMCLTLLSTIFQLYRSGYYEISITSYDFVCENLLFSAIH